MYKGKYLLSVSDKDTALALRKAIPEFSNAGEDNCDLMAVYAVVYNEADNPSGCGRLFIDEDSHFRIDYLGVLPNERGKYIGDLIARMLLFRAQELNAASVYADVPRSTLRFFSRYGFKPVEASYTDVVKMAVANSEIRLEGTCSKGKSGACGGNCDACE